MAVAVQPHLKVLGQYEIAVRVLVVPVSFGRLCRIPPAGRTMLYAPPVILLACHDECRYCSVNNGE